MVTKKNSVFRYNETFDLQISAVLETVKRFVHTLAPKETTNVYIENLSYGDFLAIKQFKADVVFMGEPDFVLKGAKTVPHRSNTDVSVELISQQTLCQADSPSICIANGRKKYELYVSSDDESFTIYISSNNDDFANLTFATPVAPKKPTVRKQKSQINHV